MIHLIFNMNVETSIYICIQNETMPKHRAGTHNIRNAIILICMIRIRDPNRECCHVSLFVCLRFVVHSRSVQTWKAWNSKFPFYFDCYCFNALTRNENNSLDNRTNMLLSSNGEEIIRISILFGAHPLLLVQMAPNLCKIYSICWLFGEKSSEKSAQNHACNRNIKWMNCFSIFILFDTYHRCMNSSHFSI